MKFLKLSLSDEKVYTFSTLTIKQRLALKDVYKKALDLQKEINRIQFDVDEKGKPKKDEEGAITVKELSPDDQNELIGIQDQMVAILIDIVRMSIARKHPEFKRDKKNEKEDIEIKDKMLELFDFDDATDVSRFAMNGEIPYREATEYDFSELKTVTSMTFSDDEKSEEKSE